ncbi:MAG: type II 3-dehydroquinate dehydratase [Gemmatimonadota bacterium]|nr:type II 3-dehydroquinate dehydratase [Gemmatimonadota bacterium]
MRIAVLNGPNLNLLGQREPALYGHQTLAEVEAMVREEAARLDCTVSWSQSNHEGALVDAIQQLPARADGLLLNAAAYTHTSLAIRDALLAVQMPFVEVHLSNLFARERRRRDSLFADLAIGVIVGFGGFGYVLALQALHRRLHGARPEA